jgi:hypothetical protein
MSDTYAKAFELLGLKHLIRLDDEILKFGQNQFIAKNGLRR